MRLHWIAIICVLGLGLNTGCLTSGDLSDSSGSSSDVISSPFESLSNSSGGGDSAYLGDVETLVVAYLETPAAPESFLRELSRVAHEHGSSDWEADGRTTRAIGAGLRRSDADLSQVEAFIARYLGDLPKAGEQVLEGYAAAPTA
jgi:hypothetical protein